MHGGRELIKLGALAAAGAVGIACGLCQFADVLTGIGDRGIDVANRILGPADKQVECPCHIGEFIPPLLGHPSGKVAFAFSDGKSRIFQNIETLDHPLADQQRYHHYQRDSADNEHADHGFDQQ